jgi:hypothetical protein
MPNYQNGKIYSIRSPNTEKYYIGSTIQNLSMRMALHRTLKNPTSSKEIINSGGAYIELIENFPCNNKEELLKREGELIRQFKDNIVNKGIAGRTKKEYMKEYNEDNKEQINIYQKKYFEDNKDKIKINKSKKINCACGSSINTSNKSYHEKSKKHLEKIKKPLENLIV